MYHVIGRLLVSVLVGVAAGVMTCFAAVFAIRLAFSIAGGEAFFDPRPALALIAALGCVLGYLAARTVWRRGVAEARRIRESPHD